MPGMTETRNTLFTSLIAGDNFCRRHPRRDAFLEHSGTLLDRAPVMITERNNSCCYGCLQRDAAGSNESCSVDRWSQKRMVGAGDHDHFNHLSFITCWKLALKRQIDNIAKCATLH